MDIPTRTRKQRRNLLHQEFKVGDKYSTMVYMTKSMEQLLRARAEKDCATLSLVIARALGKYLEPEQ